MPTDTIVDKITTKLSEQLPGKDSHLEMSSRGMDRNYHEINSNYKSAAVLLIVFYLENELNIIYMKRPGGNQNDKHSGQISFPGGKLEKDDYSLEACAVRETKEELGLDPSKLEILGSLSSLYIDVSNFMVHPFVGFYSEKPNYILQKSEVDCTIEFPLKDLYKNNIIMSKDMTVRNYTLKDVPYFDLNGEILWGATAMITNEFRFIMHSEYKRG